MLELEKVNQPVLSNVSVSLMPSDLLVIVGRIGTGKTSFLYSIMDETVKTGGKHSVKGRIAYVEQEPFIFSGSIEENICFGLEYAECRFRKVIQAS